MFLVNWIAMIPWLHYVETLNSCESVTGIRSVCVSGAFKRQKMKGKHQNTCQQQLFRLQPKDNKLKVAIMVLVGIRVYRKYIRVLLFFDEGRVTKTFLHSRFESYWSTLAYTVFRIQLIISSDHCLFNSNIPECHW